MGWFLVLLLALIALAYFLRPGTRPRRRPIWWTSSGPEHRALAPDDDEEFLRGLTRPPRRSGEED